MSRNQRIGLIVAAALVAVLAFVIASPGEDDESETTPQTTRATETGKDSGTDTQANSPPETRAVVTRIDIRAGEVAGGPAEIRVKKGDTVVIVVAADAPDDIHLHGYDIEKKVAPGQPARFRLKSNLEGEFEIESHVAEDAGRDPLVGTLIVEPR
jgi:FtsP/CotA-like multicopper oxidase with cupredoxin domain